MGERRLCVRPTKKTKKKTKRNSPEISRRVVLCSNAQLASRFSLQHQGIWCTDNPGVLGDAMLEPETNSPEITALCSCEQLQLASEIPLPCERTFPAWAAEVLNQQTSTGYINDGSQNEGPSWIVGQSRPATRKKRTRDNSPEVSNDTTGCSGFFCAIGFHSGRENTSRDPAAFG